METVLRVVCLLIAISLLLGCTDDVLEVSYATASDAVAAGAVQRGWVPAWVPSSATDLHEVHDVDTNQSVLSFLLPHASWRPPAPCRPALGGQIPHPTFERSWIPSAEDMALGYDFFSCPSGLSGSMLEAVAVQRVEQRVVHWRVLAR